MQTTQTNAEANTAQDIRIAELLETISTLKATLEECLDFVTEKHDFDKPKNKRLALSPPLMRRFFKQTKQPNKQTKERKHT